MTADRYSRAVLTVIALALVVLAARSWEPRQSHAGFLSRSATAGAFDSSAPATKDNQESIDLLEGGTIPRSWGKLVAAAAPSRVNPIFFFEAQDGTIRVVQALCRRGIGKSCDYMRK
jgi:hypothetical protein